MSLEIPKAYIQKPKEHILTPHIIEGLERGTEIGIEHLREKNIALLEKAKLVASPEKEKEIVMRLGKISIEAAKGIEELKRELRDGERSKID